MSGKPKTPDGYLGIGQEGLVRRRAVHAVSTGRVVPFLVFVTASLAVVSGVLARVLDKEDFHSYGDGIWWAIVTLGTVGYGDIVPHTNVGRVLGSIVIVFGVTFIAFLTATVTSAFVSLNQKDALADISQQTHDSEEDTRNVLTTIEQRLAAIEAKLDRLAGDA